MSEENLATLLLDLRAAIGKIHGRAHYVPQPGPLAVGSEIHQTRYTGLEYSNMIQAVEALEHFLIDAGNGPLPEGACSGNRQHRKILGPLPAEGRCAFPVPGGVAPEAPNEVC